MAEHEESKAESMMEKIVEKIHRHDSSSSSSDSEDEKKSSASSSLKSKIYRLFGREKPVHKVLGGGKRTFFLRISVIFIPKCCLVVQFLVLGCTSRCADAFS